MAREDYGEVIDARLAQDGLQGPAGASRVQRRVREPGHRTYHLAI